MENCYQYSEYYSSSSSSSFYSASPYSMSQPQPEQNAHFAQYAEAYPMSYEQVPTHQEYYQQYNNYYQVPNMNGFQPTPEPQKEEQSAIVGEYIDPKFPHRQRRRGTYSPFQTNELTKRFLKNNTIGKTERIELGKVINLTENQIKVWFQNRRHELKKRRVSTSMEDKTANTYKPY